MSDHAIIAAALVAALKDLTNVTKAHRADNAPGRHTFANIADVIAETRPVLAEHGLVALTPVHEHAEGLACTVTLLHESGERLDFGPTPFPHGKDAQATGSWITYMRRYCMLAALGMGAEDDDGESAKRPERSQPRRQERPQEPPPGELVAAVKTRLRDYLTGKVTSGTETDHALGVWQQAEVNVLEQAGQKWVTPDEVKVLFDVADGYLADLLELQGEAKDETQEALP